MKKTHKDKTCLNYLKCSDIIVISFLISSIIDEYFGTKDCLPQWVKGGIEKFTIYSARLEHPQELFTLRNFKDAIISCCIQSH